MKRYLVVGGYKSFEQKDELVKKDLIDLKDGIVDHILDVQDGKYFDHKDNVWKHLQPIT